MSDDLDTDTASGGTTPLPPGYDRRLHIIIRPTLRMGPSSGAGNVDQDGVDDWQPGWSPERDALYPNDWTVPWSPANDAFFPNDWVQGNAAPAAPAPDDGSPAAPPLPTSPQWPAPAGRAPALAPSQASVAGVLPSWPPTAGIGTPGMSAFGNPVPFGTFNSNSGVLPQLAGPSSISPQNGILPPLPAWSNTTGAPPIQPLRFNNNALAPAINISSQPPTSSTQPVGQSSDVDLSSMGLFGILANGAQPDPSTLGLLGVLGRSASPSVPSGNDSAGGNLGFVGPGILPSFPSAATATQPNEPTRGNPVAGRQWSDLPPDGSNPLTRVVYGREGRPGFSPDGRLLDGVYYGGGQLLPAAGDVQWNKAYHDAVVEQEMRQWRSKGFIATPNVTFLNPVTQTPAVADYVLSIRVADPNWLFLGTKVEPILVRDVKTGDGGPSDNQWEVYPRISGGLEVIPVGEKARLAGFIVGRPTIIYGLSVGPTLPDLH